MESTFTYKKTQVNSGGNSRIYEYDIEYKNGISVKLTNVGTSIISIEIPNKNGVKEDIVCGYESAEDYLNNSYFFGCICGRFANRIKEGKFEMSGEQYQLPINNGNNHLHGGDDGFHSKVWSEEFINQKEESIEITFSYFSIHLENGFPGNLKTEVKFTISHNEIQIDYFGKSDQDTVINLTNHSYFNLSGDLNQPITNHDLKLNADQIVILNEEQIPTGEMMSVEQTPFDFRVCKNVGTQLSIGHPQIDIGNGFDHCFIIKENPIESIKENSLKYVGELSEKKTGRVLKVYSTEPGVQVYTGNYLDGVKGKNNIAYKQRSGVCLETQHFPDSPNQPSFPTTLLKKGDTFQSSTKFIFSLLSINRS